MGIWEDEKIKRKTEEQIKSKSKYISCQLSKRRGINLMLSQVVYDL